ncbi:MAG: MarR family transcriptional regulator [Burkholderiales bacterium]
MSAAHRLAGSPGHSPQEDLDTTRLAHLVGYAASRAAVPLKQAFAHHMAPIGLKAVEFSVLVLVAANPRLNQKQLGSALDLSAPNLAVILDRLAERGLVARVRGTVDRREHRLELTLAGRELTARAEGVAGTMEREALQGLSDAERALLIELLHKVAAARPGSH